MKLVARVFWTGLALLSLFACNGKNKEAQMELQNLNWLVGAWQNNSEAGVLTETWKQNGKALSGKSYLVDSGDTVSSESMKLEIRNGAVYYVPLVPDQNNGEEVPFKLVSQADDRFVFENKLHDFPQRIIYKQLPGDSLLASIEGEIKGKTKAVDFKMKRLK